jgi:radical SAM superfamily enzyme YgiQ (UPF0313 family)
MEELKMKYEGFEVGPIRPPSEAASLLIRLTRNCPWNQCSFCSLYKGKKFSVRPVDHIVKDLETVERCIKLFKELEHEKDQSIVKDKLQNLKDELKSRGDWGYHSAMTWYRNGMTSIFLQDANSMVMKAEDLIFILKIIKEKFGFVDRITTYARSHTIARISDQDMKAFADAGLNRIHIGMESGADTVLNLVKKGVDKKTHIIAGQKVKRAGIELSEYFMPGLGGNEYSMENAIETADALNQINPDFIRIRTLAVTSQSTLYEDYQKGVFTRTNDTQMVRELLILIENLEGIQSTIKSDHILNILPEVEGQLPGDKDKMISVLKWYLDLSSHEQIIYRIGRRTGTMNFMDDLSNESLRRHVRELIDLYQVTEKTVDQVTDRLMNRFI